MKSFDLKVSFNRKAKRSYPFYNFYDILEGGLSYYGPEYDEVWSDNDGHDLYHASLSSEEYEQILTDSDFKVLTHKIRDPECGDATVWVAQKN